MSSGAEATLRGVQLPACARAAGRTATTLGTSPMPSAGDCPSHNLEAAFLVREVCTLTGLAPWGLVSGHVPLTAFLFCSRFYLGGALLLPFRREASTMFLSASSGPLQHPQLFVKKKYCLAFLRLQEYTKMQREKSPGSLSDHPSSHPFSLPLLFGLFPAFFVF